MRNFDRWLEQELNRSLGPIVSQAARPGPARYQAIEARGLWLLPFRLRRAATRRLVIAAAAATVALAGGGVLAAAAATGSLDPQVWGQHVESAVARCKAELQQGGHGIGACVSAFARHHGEEMRTQNGGIEHGRKHPGPTWLQQQTSPEASPTANP